MFGPFRQTVAAPVPRRSTDSSPDPDSSRPTTPLSSSQLAESAVMNLRKSLASQRQQAASPVPRASASAKKLSLEDRIRARLVAADASNARKSDDRSSNPSRASSPARLSDPPASHDSVPPKSPSLVPLPDSPELSPVLENTLLDEPTSILEQTGNSQAANEREGQVNAVEEKVDPLATVPPVIARPEFSADVTLLQERLKQVEQRFLDVSESFKKLQADRAAADAVLLEFTPLQSIQDTVALRDYLKSIASNVSLYQNEVKELETKMRRQEGQIQELSEKHRVELRSQSDLVERLKSQVTETEALFKASLDASSYAQENVGKQKDEVQKLRVELEQAKNSAKEEEEKRVKAISLLKTVRQKLVKTEKDRDDAFKEVTLLKEREQGDKDNEQVDRLRLQDEINAARAEKERALSRFKAQFEKEVSLLKERHDKEMSALKGQLELESVTSKASHTKEVAQKNHQITALETSLNNVTRDKNQMFDQLQMRQAEVESIQSHIESLQNQNTELQYQLRESQDRMALLTYDLQEAQREQETSQHQHQNTVPPEEVARLLSSAELKYESKLAEVKNQVRQMETERNESEAHWSRKLREKTKEVDDLKSSIEANARWREESVNLVNQLQAEKASLQEEIRLGKQKLTELLSAEARISAVEKSAKEQEAELADKTSRLEHQIEEANSRETQLRFNNKTLREELRKVQSSIALLERQRSPAIGYNRSMRADDSGSAEPRTSIQSESDSRPGTPSSTTSASPMTNDGDINVEYLRNVIFQFLEHKEMRPNLVRVISTLLRFTPQETRRLMSKV